LPAPCLDGPGGRGDNKLASFGACANPDALKSRLARVFVALAPVGLRGKLTMACRSAAKLERRAFLLWPRASVGMDVGAIALLMVVNHLTVGFNIAPRSSQAITLH